MQGPWVFTYPDSEDILFHQLAEELELAGFSRPQGRALRKDIPCFRLSSRSGHFKDPMPFKESDPMESYILHIQPSEILCVSPSPQGLFYGMQTLRQILRANRVDANTLPCLKIKDWPSLTWRCFQDDLTRGPSSRLSTMIEALELGSFLKMNLFTYYMEYQYAFEKHPQIGPPEGSLTPQELNPWSPMANSCTWIFLGISNPLDISKESCDTSATPI